MPIAGSGARNANEWTFAGMRQTMTDPQTTGALARAFLEDLAASIDTAQWREMRLRQLRYDDEGKTGVCASHDFLDANDCMAAAFEKFGIEPLPGDDDPDYENHVHATWGAAWKIATNEYTHGSWQYHPRAELRTIRRYTGKGRARPIITDDWRCDSCGDDCDNLIEVADENTSVCDNCYHDGGDDE